jgi:hypothetical protein
MSSGDSVSKKKIRLVQLADILVNDMHIKRNDCILVHSSLDRINLVDATHEDLIFLLKMLVGVEGALLMPAHSDENNPEHNSGTRPDKDILNVLFSKMPETVRLTSDSRSYTLWGKLLKDTPGENVKILEEAGAMKLLNKTEVRNVRIMGIGFSVTAYPNLKDSLVFEKHGIAFSLS